MYPKSFPAHSLLPTFFRIFEKAVALSSMNCWLAISLAMGPRACVGTNLQFVQVISELLKAFFESYEAC
jgi:hypothetical protein